MTISNITEAGKYIESRVSTPVFGGDFNIDAFTSYFEGGARTYLFLWTPDSNHLNTDYKYLVRASSVPQSSVEEVVTEYQHVNFKSGGKRIYDDWTISLNVDVKSKLRGDFEKWMNKIAKVDENTETKQYYFDNYKSTQTFEMLDNNGVGILSVKLIDAWPKTIGPITMDYSSQDFAQFDVTFSYLYHVIENI